MLRKKAILDMLQKARPKVKRAGGAALPPDKSKKTLKRRMLSLKGLVVGVLAGFLAVGFNLSLEFAEKLRNSLYAFVHAHGHAWWVIPPLAIGSIVTLITLLTLRFAPDAGGSGIPHLKGYLEGELSFRARIILIVKFVGGVIGIGSGLALGNEGPTAQLGAAVAKVTGDVIAPNRMERKILVSAGAGAGLAAAFNAPFTGVFFVLEDLQQSFNQPVLVAAFVACVSADIVCRLILGHLPVFHIQILSYPDIDMFPYFILLGVFLGFLGLFFNRSLLFFNSLFQKMGFKMKVAYAAFTGICLGVIGLFLPTTLGLGGGLITNILSGKIGMYPLMFFFALRFFMTMTSASTGSPGGIFSPMLLLGVISGCFFGYTMNAFDLNPVFELPVWGVLGMAGYFSAVVRAPITGTMLILEMTNAYNLLLPLMAVSIISYSIPEYFKNVPIYDALLHQYLSRVQVKYSHD